MRRLLAVLGLFLQAIPSLGQAILTESLMLTDTIRQRRVPITTYQPASADPSKPSKVAIISHGYGGHNTGYSFIANWLVSRGYYVASIQHELPGDEPIPTTGNPRVVRRPNWERGVQTIRFVVGTLQQRHPRLNVRDLLLVGHSNGGDQSMLYAQTYPAEVAAVISLDNRRMPLPRVNRPKIGSIRSSDQAPDEGVLPTPDEQRAYGMTIIKLDVRHNDMWDGATPDQKRAMLDVISQFLQAP